MSGNRQEKFENFLDNQQAREQAIWFRDLPSVLAEVVNTIKEVQARLAGTEKAEKFELNSATKLRSTYKNVVMIINGKERNYQEFVDSKQAISTMISQINAWFRSTKLACGMKITRNPKFYGKASIPEKFEIITSDDFIISGNQW